MPAIIFGRRRRPCCLLPAGFPFVVPFFVPVGRRAALPPAREDDAPPDRELVVPPRPPAGGRPAPADPRPPPPVLRVRTCGGRRTDPARGATGEVSSWDGTRNPSLTGLCRQVFVGEPVYRSQPCCCERGVFSCASAGGPSPTVPGWGCCDGGARRDGGLPGGGVYSVATRRRPLRGCRPGTGSAPSTYEKSR